MENGLTPPNIALQLKRVPMIERFTNEILNDPTIALSLVALGMAFSRRLRKEVYERQGGKCAACGKHFPKLQTHHIVPHYQGGPDTKENAVGLCPPCHLKLDKLAIAEHIYYPDSLTLI